MLLYYFTVSFRSRVEKLGTTTFFHLPSKFDDSSCMKHLLMLCLFFTAVSQADAQFGITAATTHSHSVEWQVVTENFVVHRRAEFLRYGTTGVIDYTINTKRESIKLRPAIHLMLANSVYQRHYFQASSIGLLGNVELALLPKLDLKRNKRPIRPFLQLSPGISLVSLRYDYPKGDNDIIEVNKDKRISPNLGANLFFEFKLSPLLTIAPTVGLRYYPNLKWKNLTEQVTKGLMTNTYDRTNWKQYSFGLRVGLNFD
jgi:hypothetical protein